MPALQAWRMVEPVRAPGGQHQQERSIVAGRRIDRSGRRLPLLRRAVGIQAGLYAALARLAGLRDDRIPVDTLADDIYYGSRRFLRRWHGRDAEGRRL